MSKVGETGKAEKANGVGETGEAGKAGGVGETSKKRRAADFDGAESAARTRSTSVERVEPASNGR